MKNLLIYVNPSKKFEDIKLAEAQLDNCLRMEWKPEDIVLATNFDYEYKGIKSLVVADYCYNVDRRRASKLTTICYLFDKKLIVDDIYWFHDFDAFQLEKLDPKLGKKDAGFVNYGTEDHIVYWNSGSFFFKSSAEDIFQSMKYIMHKYGCHDEQALCTLTERNTDNINSRYKMLNCTYNYCRVRDTKDLYDQADKPIKVIHFDPRVEEVYNEVKPLLSKDLVEIFNEKLINIY
jgi:hypothetical protein